MINFKLLNNYFIELLLILDSCEFGSNQCFLLCGLGGVLSCGLTHTMIVSKLNQEKGATAGNVLRKLGFAGVWKGHGPRIVMIGTLTAAQWFIYDGVKIYLCMPRPPPSEMPESLKKKTWNSINFK
ncbi:hypothetical protein HCN44_006882 [Aphidius gifuensis]|uniref:Uncharacterized protein n=1 Tax=Aphidius gifuensis TaxID=684658 RepID=A0A834XYA4_APHGI|nr:hypothetical protein HCN44_006882 [Aphidius gifuensis]